MEARQVGESLTYDEVKTIMDIAQRQAALLDDLEAALEANDVARVFAVAREVCGIQKESQQ